MTLTSQIQETVQRLPVAFQAEVLDFVEHLLLKVEREALRHEEQEWSHMSLAAAVRGMDEDSDIYTADDLDVVF